MSDHEYLCGLYGVDSLHQHELIDTVLDGDERAELEAQDSLFLAAGRKVHVIGLTLDSPANCLGAAFNYTLRGTVAFDGYNYLSGADPEEPGSWFVRSGFVVRSKKEEGRWIQFAFKSLHSPDLTRTEIIDYLRVSRLSTEHDGIESADHPTFVHCSVDY